MKAPARRTALLGELVAVAFDGAARYSTDPREVSRLATQAVGRVLQRARWFGRTRAAERAAARS